MGRGLWAHDIGAVVPGVVGAAVGLVDVGEVDHGVEAMGGGVSVEEEGVAGVGVAEVDGGPGGLLAQGVSPEASGWVGAAEEEVEGGGTVIRGMTYSDVMMVLTQFRCLEGAYFQKLLIG